MENDVSEKIIENWWISLDHTQRVEIYKKMSSQYDRRSR